MGVMCSALTSWTKVSEVRAGQEAGRGPRTKPDTLIVCRDERVPSSGGRVPAAAFARLTPVGSPPLNVTCVQVLGLQGLPVGDQPAGAEMAHGVKGSACSMH